MDANSNLPRIPQPRLPLPSGRDRQMTLGEALAVSRAISSAGMDGQRTVDIDSLVHSLETYRVCDVCGWTERAHEGSQRPLTCGSYAHAMHR